MLVVVVSCKKNSNVWQTILDRTVANMIILCDSAEKKTHLKGSILYLKCNDDYDGLPEKVICAIEVVVSSNCFNRITRIVKVDDHDTKNKNRIYRYPSFAKLCGSKNMENLWYIKMPFWKSPDRVYMTQKKMEENLTYYVENRFRI